MATNKELTAKNRELKQMVKKLEDKHTQLYCAIDALKAQLVENVAVETKLVNAISGFDGPAYETYLGLAERMGKRDDQIIDISIRLGLLRRVYELAASGRLIKQEDAITIPF